MASIACSFRKFTELPALSSPNMPRYLIGCCGHLADIDLASMSLADTYHPPNSISRTESGGMLDRLQRSCSRIDDLTGHRYGLSRMQFSPPSSCSFLGVWSLNRVLALGMAKITTFLNGLDWFDSYAAPATLAGHAAYGYKNTCAPATRFRKKVTSR